MASCENKYTTLLDLSRQAKVITGETACFDGKIEVGIPFSGYPTGVDTGTTVSLGVVSSETAVFSGNTGTTVFDVSNTGSTNYNALFSGYSGTVWTNALFSGNTSGLTLPITTLSADTQIVGPFWTLTQTGMTGDYVIGTQYTGYSITYAFSQVGQMGIITGYTAYSGFTSASQENFSAGTLDYKGPLDYISSVEDASIDGRLTTKKLTVTDGASSSTAGYVLTQLDDTGKAGWVYNGSSSGTTFTGNTSGTCITDLYLTNLYGCSPLHIEPSGLNDVYMVENGGSVGIGTITPSDGQLHIDGDSTVSRGLYVETDYSGNGVSEGIRVLNWTTSILNPLFPIGGLIWGRASGQNRYSYGLIGASGLATWTNIQVMMGVRGVAGVSLSSNIDAYGIWGESIISNSGDNIGGYFIAENPGAGNNYAIIVPPSGGTVGIGTETPTESLHIEGGNIRIQNGSEQIKSEMDTIGPILRISADTDSYAAYAISSTNGGGDGGIAVGIRGATEPSLPGYGKQGDSFVYSSVYNNGLNIISQPTVGPQVTDDYIRFYAGQDANGTTPDLYIQGSGATRGNVGINTDIPTEKLHVEGSIRMVDGTEQNGYVLTSDADGVGTWQASSGGGGATIDPYQDEGNVTSITWDVSGTSTNYEATLTGVTTLTMSNVRNGDYGTLIVTQDGTGSRTLSFVGANHKVVNGGGGAPTLTTTATATDILSFTYNGTNFYWTVGNDYT